MESVKEAPNKQTAMIKYANGKVKVQDILDGLRKTDFVIAPQNPVNSFLNKNGLRLAAKTDVFHYARAEGTTGKVIVTFTPIGEAPVSASEKAPLLYKLTPPAGITLAQTEIKITADITQAQSHEIGFTIDAKLSKDNEVLIEIRHATGAPAPKKTANDAPAPVEHLYAPVLFEVQ